MAERRACLLVKMIESECWEDKADDRWRGEGDMSELGSLSCGFAARF